MARDVRPGARLGPYILGELLGRGGMGAVFATRHPETGADLVIKVLLSSLGEIEQLRLRFVREAETYRKLRHPGVAGYVASGVEGEVLYLVLERVRGPTLLQVLASQPRGLGLEAGVGLLRELAAVLAVAHDLGIVHRDLKPQNVIMESGDRPRLIDFGLAAADDALLETRSGTRLGSYLYAAPEQNEGRKVDHRADLYSLGVLGYEALTGRPPFQGEKVLSVLLDQLNEKFPAPSTLVEDLPAGIEALLVRLLRASPGDRFQSASELRAALEAATP